LCPSDVVTNDDLVEAVDVALAMAKENGDFKGDKGTTFYPDVSEDGLLSWTNDGGEENPDPVNIKGEPCDACDACDSPEWEDMGLRSEEESGLNWESM